MVMLGGAGNRFGEYLFMNCANLPDLLVAVNLPIENSLDLLPTFGSLAMVLHYLPKFPGAAQVLWCVGRAFA